MLFPQTIYFDYLKIPLAFSFLVFILLVRSFYLPSLESIQTQLQVSNIYGISFKVTVVKVICPQTKKALLICLSLLYFWLISDFAILKSAGVQIQTPGLIIEDFISSYRLNAAVLLSFFVFVSWLVYSLFLGFLTKGDHVTHSKYSS